MSGIQYRAITAGDAQAIIDCALEAFWPVDGTSAWDRAMGFVPGQDWASKKCRSLGRFVEAHPERCQVAHVGDRIAGFVMWRVDPTDLVGEVENLAQDSAPKRRMRGGVVAMRRGTHPIGTGGTVGAGIRSRAAPTVGSPPSL